MLAGVLSCSECSIVLKLAQFMRLAWQRASNRSGRPSDMWSACERMVQFDNLILPLRSARLILSFVGVHSVSRNESWQRRASSCNCFAL